MSTKRFTTPDGHQIRIERDGEIFIVWQEGEPDRPVASVRDFLAHAVLDAIGYDVAHDDLPPWSDSFGAEVLKTFDRGG